MSVWLRLCPALSRSADSSSINDVPVLRAEVDDLKAELARMQSEGRSLEEEKRDLVRRNFDLESELDVGAWGLGPGTWGRVHIPGAWGLGPWPSFSHIVTVRVRTPCVVRLRCLVVHGICVTWPWA